MATIYTFKQYTWSEFEANNEDGLATGGVNWDAYPTADSADWAALMRAAGWTDNDETGVGMLTSPWNGHPEGAWIVSDGTQPGLAFAVSNEAAA
jgi:hypothetical protein